MATVSGSFKVDAIVVGGSLRHSRQTNHRGTQDDTTVVLFAPIGSYPAGMTVHDVLASLMARIVALDSTNTRVGVFTVNAVIQPHFFVAAVLAKATSSTFTVDARVSGGGTRTLDAVIRRTTARTFTANASLV